MIILGLTERYRCEALCIFRAVVDTKYLWVLRAVEDASPYTFIYKFVVFYRIEIF